MIKGWRKVKDTLWKSINHDGYYISVSKWHTGRINPLYRGWLVYQLLPSGAHILIFPEEEGNERIWSNPKRSWFNFTKKDAVRAAIDWMREHSYPSYPPKGCR